MEKQKIAELVRSISEEANISQGEDKLEDTANKLLLQSLLTLYIKQAELPELINIVSNINPIGEQKNEKI